MAYFPDLSNECQLASGGDVRAVGWLDKKHSFIKGEVDEEFLQILKRHIEMVKFFRTQNSLFSLFYFSNLIPFQTPAGFCSLSLNGV